MKNFILEIKPKSGMLTELQSDTIYGHFCWRLKEKSGVEKLNSFIAHYRNSEAVFLLSDGLLKNKNQIYFPLPYVFQKPEMKETKNTKVLEFVKRKKSKEQVYLSLEQMNSFLNTSVVPDNEGDPIDLNIQPKAKKEVSNQLRVSVQIDRNNFSSSEGKLFFYNPKFLRNDLTYAVLVKVLNESLFKEYDCENMLKEVFELGFGKKKSSGYGHFDIIGFYQYEGILEPKKANSIMMIGNYLPSNEDPILPIGYDINIKYGKYGEEKSQDQNPFKNPMVMMTAGSCFKTSNPNRKHYGRVTDPNEISDYHPETVQFGMPFFLKFNYVINNR